MLEPGRRAKPISKIMFLGCLNGKKILLNVRAWYARLFFP